MIVPKPILDVCKQSFLYQGPVLWNNLSQDKELQLADIFKRIYKRGLHNGVEGSERNVQFYYQTCAFMSFLTGPQGRIQQCNWPIQYKDILINKINKKERPLGQRKTPPPTNYIM